MTHQRKIVQRSVVTIFLSLLLLSSPCLALDFKYPAKVERVIDGDTIVVDLSLGLGVILNDQTIRFYGIDAWEVSGEERPKGLLAKQYVEKMIEEGEIVIEIRPDWGQNGKGKYGRWLGKILVDGKDLNQELVEQGHADDFQKIVVVLPKVYPDQPLTEHLPEEPGIPEEKDKVVGPFKVVAVCFRGNPGGTDEWVVVQNTSDRTYNLKRWRIADDPRGGHEFEIKEFIELGPGQTLAITNTETAEVTVFPDWTYCIDYDNHWWNNDGDMVRLIDPQGDPVLEEMVENTSNLRMCR